MNNELRALMEVVENDYDVDTREYKDYLSELQNNQNYVFYDNMTMHDVVWEMIDNGDFGEISEHLRPYLNDTSLAEDLLNHDGYTETEWGVIRVIW